MEEGVVAASDNPFFGLRTLKNGADATPRCRTARRATPATAIRAGRPPRRTARGCHAENRRRHQTEANHRAAQELAARRGRGTAAGRALAGVNAAARAAHVSYGQYVAILKDAEARKLRPEEVKARLEAASTW